MTSSTRNAGPTREQSSRMIVEWGSHSHAADTALISLHQSIWGKYSQEVYLASRYQFHHVFDVALLRRNILTALDSEGGSECMTVEYADIHETISFNYLWELLCFIEGSEA